ncbi:DUF5995 family protein [Deinococcus multiflagellatus]|uniref:DUF5995 family protein n=1 Tax=Deinococcus multiflagellatus TaxID=1656887 RepID=A0ABW1ZKK4_9DEIO|nr:DUF5995 family protein [Deinococcus multiflagellatus]MBZ9713806.1 DUF5995 family protein [Deinococcus multiflagellatus]
MTFEERRPTPTAAPAARQLPLLPAPSPQAPVEAEQEQEAVMAVGPTPIAERATGPLSPWRKSGKLVGNPPIRDEKDVPNIKIVESEQNYKTLLAGAKSLLKGQRDRADAMLSKDKTKVLDYRYWFAKVYSYVTEQEIRYCEERTFDYPSYVMQCVLNFDKIYADNLKAAQAQVEPHWKAAFQTAHDMQHGDGFPVDAAGVLFALVASMLAHIRYDLPRAEAWVAEKYGQQFGAKPSDFKADFFRMSGVFDISGRKMYGDIQRLMGPNTVSQLVVKLGIQANMTDGAMRYVMGADMSTERLETWRRMTAMVSQDLTPKNPYTLKDGKLNGDITKTPSAGIAPLGQVEPDNLRPDMKGIQSSTLERYGQVFAGLHIWGQDVIQNFVLGGKQAVANETQAYLDPQRREKMVPERHASMLLQLIYLDSRGFDPEAQTLAMLALKTAKAQGSLVLVVNMVDAFTLVKSFPMEEREAVSNLLTQDYFPHLEPLNAANLIIKWSAIGIQTPFVIAQILRVYNALSSEKKKTVKRILAEEKAQIPFLR